MKVRAKDLCNTGKVKPPALANEVKRGNLIRDEKKNFDLNNSKNRDWCIRHGINPDTCKATTPGTVEVQKKEKPQKKQTHTPATKTKSKLADEEFKPPAGYTMADVESVMVLTGLANKMLKYNIFELVMKFGGPQQLKGWVDILDKLMSAQKKDVDIQEKRKDLVPRQFVEFLKSYVNTYNSQLFDFAEGCTTEIIALIKTDSKKAKTEIPEMLRRNFSKLAAETVKRIDKEVKNLKVHNESDNE